jgi:alpha-tubulin suppressor-like RCC1 family protein
MSRPRFDLGLGGALVIAMSGGCAEYVDSARSPGGDAAIEDVGRGDGAARDGAAEAAADSDCESDGDASCECRAAPASAHCTGKCGTLTDSCGRRHACGTCALPEVCGGTGVPNVCGCSSTWSEGDCAGRCGEWRDDCGRPHACGECQAGESCGPDRLCHCARKTCADVAKTCGDMADGCGGTISCGTCAAACTATGCEGVEEVVLGDSHACARLADGSVWCWGEGDKGQIGDGATSARPKPTRVPIPLAAVRIAAGTAHTCALLSDTTVRCWGDNGSGQIGDGSTSMRGLPVGVTDLRDVDALAAGGATTCVRRQLRVLCFGSGVHGTIGDGSRMDRHVPTLVSAIEDAGTIAMGSAHVCVLTTAHQIKCWGDNTDGQIGVGASEADYATPQLVGGKWDILFAGYGATCGVTAGGRMASAECWGRTGTVQSSVPAHISEMDRCNRLSLGATHRCSLYCDNGARCWLGNANGQIGDGTTEPRETPTRVLTGAKAISAGAKYSCAVTSSGGVKCWGGLPLSASSTLPIDVIW